MKIVSWNVNGIRAIMKKNFFEFVNKERPDVLCIQETKAHPEQVDTKLPDYPHHYWNSAQKKGYSGTAVFSKIKPLRVDLDMKIDHHDNEGRVIELEFKDFTLINVYTPNAGTDGLKRLGYRQEWDKDFLTFIKRKEKKKPVIVCGDMNVAPTEIDLARPKQNVKNAGFTPEEREGFKRYLDNGFADVFRALHPKKIQYSWWSYRANARARNVGWRIDHFLCSERFLKQVKQCDILDDVKGSDHCPVRIVLKE